jgi:hypothetical protein
MEEEAFKTRLLDSNLLLPPDSNETAVNELGHDGNVFYPNCQRAAGAICAMSNQPWSAVQALLLPSTTSVHFLKLFRGSSLPRSPGKSIGFPAQ